MGHPQTSVDTFSARMQNILHIANGLKEITSSSNPSCHSPFTCSHSSVIDSIGLPNPYPILPLLLQAGADRGLATAASKIYELRAEELRRYIQESVVTAARKILELPAASSASIPDLSIKKILSAATEVYLRRLGQWKEEIVQRVEHASKLTLNAIPPRNTRTFNYEYVPLLESFFKENPFPTHADKMFLAKKSTMEYRQIHVWFQNRRNRTKKEGKPLRKKEVYEAPAKPLHEYMRSRVVLHSQVPRTSKTRPKRASEIEVAQNNMSKDAFTSSSPPHAFPSPYPPACHYEPFPCKSGPFHFGKPDWRRLSCGDVPLLLSTTTSIDELVDKFSQLSVRDEARFKGSPKLLSDSHAATSAITVIPSCAPHPSLLLCESRQEANPVERYPIIRAGIPSSKVFRGSSPTSRPATLVPPLVSSDRSKRKTTPLPRRFPGRMRSTCRDTTPSESSSTSSPSPRLFSSDIEGHNYSVSSVSSLSTPSDTQELPRLYGSPCSSLFGSPSGVAAITVPPISYPTHDGIFSYPNSP